MKVKIATLSTKQRILIIPGLGVFEVGGNDELTELHLQEEDVEIEPLKLKKPDDLNVDHFIL